MFRHKVFYLGPGGGLKETGVGHDDSLQSMVVGVGVVFKRPLGSSLAAVGCNGDGGVVELEIGNVVVDNLFGVTTCADTDDDAIPVEGHALVGTAGCLIQKNGRLVEHVAQGQEGAGLAALRAAIKADDLHNTGVRNMVARGRPKTCKDSVTTSQFHL